METILISWLLNLSLWFTHRFIEAVVQSTILIILLFEVIEMRIHVWINYLAIYLLIIGLSRSTQVNRSVQRNIRGKNVRSSSVMVSYGLATSRTINLLTINQINFRHSFSSFAIFYIENMVSASVLKVRGAIDNL